MPTTRRLRNAVPPFYALLVVLGFLISPKVGAVVAIVGAMLMGVLWVFLSGPSGKPGEPGYVAGRDRSARAQARAARRGR